MCRVVLCKDGVALCRKLVGKGITSMYIDVTFFSHQTKDKASAPRQISSWSSILTNQGISILVHIGTTNILPVYWLCIGPHSYCIIFIFLWLTSLFQARGLKV